MEQFDGEAKVSDMRAERQSEGESGSEGQAVTVVGLVTVDGKSATWQCQATIEDGDVVSGPTARLAS